MDLEIFRIDTKKMMDEVDTMGFTELRYGSLGHS